MENSDSDIRLVWEDEMRVRSFDVDCTGTLRLATLFNYFEDTAAKHATNLRAGYTVLRELGLFWVLSRAKVRIHRLPAWSEVVRLATWPKGLDGVLFLRDFQLVGQGAEPLVDCSTGWLLLDDKTYKPQLPDVLPTTIPPNTRGHALAEQLRKLKAFTKVQPVYERTVLASEIDLNRHVNNARYVDWIMDCYAPEAMTQRSVRSMQINYVGESTYGNIIRLHMATDPSRGEEYVEGVNAGTGAKVVQALLKIDN